MAKRIVTKIGNVFCAEIEGKYKVYFQYICNDIECLNSSVIRVFKKRYDINDNPLIENIVKDDVLFYAHTILRNGIVFNAWHKVGTSKELGLEGLSDVYFAFTKDHRDVSIGEKVITDPKTGKEITISLDERIEVDPLTNWNIWKVNEPIQNLNTFPIEYIDKTELGYVFSHETIVNRLKLGYYKITNFDFSVLKRKPLPDVSSYLKKVIDGHLRYFHFIGSDVYREVVMDGDTAVRLSRKNPKSGDFEISGMKFWEINWHYHDFIEQEDFDKVWNEKPA